MIEIEITGIEGGVALLARMAAGAHAMQGQLAYVGSDLPYAYGIEYGRRQSGRLARARGGAFYMAGAARQVLTDAVGDQYAKGIEEGPGGVRQVTTQVERQLITVAQGIVPVVTGRLRGSIRALPGL